MAFAVFPAEFVVPGLFAVDFEDEFAAAWIEIEIAADDEVAGETIAAGVLRFEAGGDFDGFVDGHAIGGLAFGIVKLFAGDVVSSMTLGTVGTAVATIFSAACMYFSSSSGETVSTSAMVSKP